MNKKKAVSFLIVYTLLFVIITSGVFFVFIREQKGFVWGVDGIAQYLPKAYYYITHAREFFGNLFHGSFVFDMVDFSIALGDPVPIHTEPLYFLMLLFNPENVEAAYTFVTFLRLYLAGLSMCVFLLYLKKETSVAVFSGFVYIFASYALFGSMRHSHFLSAMITLPLGILAIEEIYRDGKWYLCTIFVALNLWCGYYFTYMNTLAMGIYFLVRFAVGERERSVRIFFRKAFTIAGTYLCGVLIANITLFNTFANFLRSDRNGITNEKVGRNLISYGSGWLVKCYQYFINNSGIAGSWLCLGFIPLCYFFVIILLLRKGNKEQKLLLMIGTIMMLFPVFGYMMTGFSNINNRWSYMIAFLMAVIASTVIPEIFTLKKWELMILAISVLPYAAIGCFGLFGFKKDFGSVFTSCFLLLSFAVILLVRYLSDRSRKLSMTILYSFMVISFWISGYLRYDSAYGNMIEDFDPIGKAMEVASDTPLKAYKEIEDESFYRVDTHSDVRRTNSSSLILGDNSLAIQNSTINKNVVDFLVENGSTDWIVTRLMGFDDRSYLNGMASVKYFIMDENDIYDVPYGYEFQKSVKMDNHNYAVYVNPDALSLGYTYDSALPLSALSEMNALDKQEVMLQTAVIPDEKVSEDFAEGIPKILNSKVKITDISFGKDGSCLTEEGIHVKRNDTMTISFEGLSGCETYLVWKDAVKETKSSIDIEVGCGDTQSLFSLRSKYDTYYTKQKDYVFNLGYSENAKDSCTMKFLGGCDVKIGEIEVYCLPMTDMKEHLQKRSEDSLCDVEMSSNMIKGRISLDQKKILNFSIPQLDGWTCYVDGVKTELFNVNIMFMGTYLEAGEHEIVLRYELPGIRISLLLSAIGVMIFVSMYIIAKKRR